MIERPPELGTHSPADPPGGPEPSPDEEPATGHRERLRREWPVGLALAGIVGSLGWLAVDHFRSGTLAFAGSVALAAVLRLLLPARHVGLLAVRGRAFDVVTLLLLAAGAAALAIVVPELS